jgi:Domain of unknown function (DUF4136)
MKVFRLILPLALLAASGFAQDVRYNFDSATNFSNFKTYKWVDIKDGGQLNQLQDRQVKAAIDAELAKKGLTKVEGDADLVVGYQAAVNQEKQFTSYSSGFGPGWGYGPGWRGGYGGFDSSTTIGQTSTIHIGSIAFDMYDASKHLLVWRGEASKTLDVKAKPEKQQKNLAKAVAKMLKNYPPPVKK